MVARTPPKLKKMAAPLNPVLLRETVQKMDRCMARLQELQFTVTGGTKVISGVSLSPRSTRGYLRTSLRCKQESLRIKSVAPKKSPTAKFPANAGEEWRRMSLPAMLVGETVGEILQASQFAREIVASAITRSKRTASDDPKTPVTHYRKQRPNPENTELRSRRRREKQMTLQSIRSEADPPSLVRARSRINFKPPPPPPKRRENEKENHVFPANRVSPKHRPWAKKTILFPNPLFHSADPSAQPKFSKTRSPVIGRNRQTPHKFLVKSPVSPSKFRVKIKSPPPISISPTRSTNLGRNSPKVSTASKLRRSFSPSRLANRLVSPLRSRRGVQKSDGVMSGMKQRPISMPLQISKQRI
ncbi:probable microtubule-binding protein TANGLED [Malania oleifera]|uniref:probable microtubule-binding protein TANGLED n=1 Tax=Malania oleifera TaxID=397392 RepID=UPI0025AE7545|nr:probable microtubule-binding protein TANGLED [Malania oleifera]